MILLTGATGFLGSSLLKKILAKGYEVCCIKRSSSDCSRVADLKEQCIWHDADKETLESVFKRHPIQIVIHCATNYGRNETDSLQVYKTNVSFPLELLEQSMKHECRYFINTDSFFVRQINCPREGEQNLYMGAYTKSKYIFTRIVKDEISNWNLAFINMQLEHIYGPEDSAEKFVAFLLGQLQKNVAQMELTEGIQTRDWTYLEDALGAYLAVLQNIDRFEKGNFYQFEVGTGKETSLREFVEEAKKVTGSSTELLFGRKKMQVNELMHSCADNRALLDLGWSPQFNITAGIKKIVGDR